MIKPIIYLQLRVGTTAGQPEEIKYRLTVDEIHKIVKGHFNDFTQIKAVGQWNSKTEDTALIDIFTVINSGTYQQIFLLCQKVHEAIKGLFDKMNQKEILVTVRVSIGRREISWMRFVSWDGENLIDPPFPFASLLVRKLAPEVDIGLPLLHKSITDYCYEVSPGTYQHVPAFCFQKKQAIHLKLTGPGKFQWSRRNWDKHILYWDRHLLSLNDDTTPAVPPELQLEFKRNSDYIALFQQTSLGVPVYYATKISNVLIGPPISVNQCSYYQGTGCCEASNLKLLDLWLKHELDERKMKESLQGELSLTNLYETPYPMVGMEVVTLTPGGHILRKKRSQDVGAFPGAYGLIPSGMVEPVPGCKHPSVYYSFLRELDEEMFRGPEKGETVNSLLKRPHIKDLSGNLYYIGHCFVLLNRFVVLCLLFKPHKQWWDKYEGEIYTSWEYAPGSTDPVPINDAWEHAHAHPSEYTPGAYAALKFAFEYLNTRR